MPAHLCSFILSHSKRILNNFRCEIDGLKANNMFYLDTDSLHVDKKYWDVLVRAGLVGENLCQGEDGYNNVGIFYGLFLAPKNYCSTIG